MNKIYHFTFTPFCLPNVSQSSNAVIRGHLYTRRLILKPISAARPRIDLCTKNTPPNAWWSLELKVCKIVRSICISWAKLKAMFSVQVFWYWSENCPFQTGKGFQRLRMLRTGGSPTLYGVLNVFEFLYFLILFLFLFLFLFYSILFYSILFYSILFYSILFYSILFYSILFHLKPHRIIYNIYFLVSEKVYFKTYMCR